MEETIYSPINSETAQCLVCGTHCLSPYVDVTLITSRTSHSETPVRDKVRSIIGDKWILSKPDLSFFMCLSCYQLVNQFDILESQLRGIKDKLCDKYVSFHGLLTTPEVHQDNCLRTEKNNFYNSNVNSGKRRRPIRRHNQPGRKHKPPTEKKDILLLQQNTANQENNKKNKTGATFNWHQDADHQFVHSITHLPGYGRPVHQEGDHTVAPFSNGVGDCAWKNAENVTSVCNRTDKAQVLDSHEPLNDEDLNTSHADSVYDDLHGMLTPGERLRIGIVVFDEGSTSYSCCYCGQLFISHPDLKNHFFSSHNPEILTTRIPPELGLGSKVNCGVQIANVIAVSEFSKPFACIFCDSVFKFKSNVCLHYKEKHTPYKPFACVDCQESFRRNIELSRHRVYYCQFRKKTSTSANNSSK